ncbi:MAG: IclR family transcriptional regulator [Actinobacteria bacterium]|nr:IclR family transcriptional regulator [Actinomycetota bacterium]
MSAEAATSLRRGLAVLAALAGDEAVRSGGLGVTRIATLIGREKSQVSRTLKILAEDGVVDRDPRTLAYRLSWRFLTLAAQAGDRRLLQQGPSVLRAVVAELGETAHLSVLHGAQVLTVLSESPGHAVEAAGWVGRTVPAYCTASGRALLFDHARDDLDALFADVEFRRMGPKTARDLAELRVRVAAGRARGYAAVDEELEPGLVAVAAPVRDVHGTILAALNVSAPKFRFGRRLSAAGKTVKAAADDLSATLGWAPEVAAAEPVPWSS